MEKSFTMAAVCNIIIGVFFVLLGCNYSVPETGIVVNPEGDTLAITATDTVIVVPVDTNANFVAEPAKPEIENTPLRHPDITEIYLSQVGVREATGNNDGKQVEKYLRSVGLSKGYAWCAAFVHWCLDSAGVPNNITAWAPSAHNKNNIVWMAGRVVKDPQAGDVGCLYYPSLKRIGHTFFYHRSINGSIYESVEGNTNSEGSREGDGVYRKKRSFNATYSITRYKN